MSYQPLDEENELHNSPTFSQLQSSKSTLDIRRRPKYGFDPQRLHFLISIAAGTVMCLFGYEQGVFGGIIVGQEFQEYFNHPSPSLTGFVTSIYDLGCFAGALLTLVVGEWLGRKRMLIVFTIIMTTGILIQTGAHSMNHLLWGRFIAGIGNGGNTATAPVWHVETSLDHAKGKAVVKEMVVNVFGFVVSNVITLAFSSMTTEAQWRFPLGIQLIFIVIILTLVPILPESPRWLLARGRDAEAKVILAALNEDDIELEFKAIRDSVREEQAVQASWAQIFRGGQATRRLLLGMLLQVWYAHPSYHQIINYTKPSQSTAYRNKCFVLLPTTCPPQKRRPTRTRLPSPRHRKRHPIHVRHRRLRLLHRAPRPAPPPHVHGSRPIHRHDRHIHQHRNRPRRWRCPDPRHRGNNLHNILFPRIRFRLGSHSLAISR